MAEKDKGKEDDVNLELPSLPFGRKRKRKAEPAADETPVEGTAPIAPAEPERAVPEAPVADDPTDMLPRSPDRFAPPTADQTVAHDPAPAPYAAPETLGAAEQAIDPEQPAKQPFDDEQDVERTAQLPGSTTTRAEKPEKPAKPAREPKPVKPPKPARQLPSVPGRVAAVVVGALVGLLACGGTYLGLLGCQEVRGTSACGGPGFFILLAIMVALVFIGSLLLRLLRVPDAGSTSFLGVGLMAVIALAFLIDVIFEWWMVLAIPGVTALTFAGAHWLTTRFSEPADA